MARDSIQIGGLEREEISGQTINQLLIEEIMR